MMWGIGVYNGRITESSSGGVRQIQANHHAFAAILGDGSVTTWGVDESGGDSDCTFEPDVSLSADLQSFLGCCLNYVATASRNPFPRSSNYALFDSKNHNFRTRRFQLRVVGGSTFLDS